MDHSAIKNTYLIRADLHWDKLFDGAVLLRWEDKRHIVKSQDATGLLDFLNNFTGGPLELDDLLTFESLEKPLKHLIETELLCRTVDAPGDCKMSEWYNRNAISLPHPKLTFMNHGYTEPPNNGLTWVRPENWDQRYQNILVRYLVRRANIKQKTVLDIGCDRGGTASYMARYDDTSKVVGLRGFYFEVHRLSSEYKFAIVPPG